MKTYQIELQRVKSMSNSHGLIHVRMEAIVQARPPRQDAGDESTPHSVLSLSEDNARVLLLLLKQQITEFDKRKAKSRF